VKLAGTAGKGQRCAVLGGAGEDGVACETWGLFGCRPEIAKPKFGSSHNYGKPYFVAKVLHLVGDKNLAKKQWQLFGLLP
jgi:hypothetical protein